MVKRLKLILIVLCIGLLTSCSLSASPNPSIVQQAIALQLEQIQQDLTQHLSSSSVETVTPKPNHIKITKKQTLTLADQKAYRVQGTYDLTVPLSSQRLTQHDNEFDIYLQPQASDKSWNLMRQVLDAASNTYRWQSTPIPPSPELPEVAPEPPPVEETETNVSSSASL